MNVKSRCPSNPNMYNAAIKPSPLDLDPQNSHSPIQSHPMKHIGITLSSLYNFHFHPFKILINLSSSLKYAIKINEKYVVFSYTP